MYSAGLGPLFGISAHSLLPMLPSAAATRRVMNFCDFLLPVLSSSSSVHFLPCIHSPPPPPLHHSFLSFPLHDSFLSFPLHPSSSLFLPPPYPPPSMIPSSLLPPSFLLPLPPSPAPLLLSVQFLPSSLENVAASCRNSRIRIWRNPE